MKKISRRSFMKTCAAVCLLPASAYIVPSALAASPSPDDLERLSARASLSEWIPYGTPGYYDTNVTIFPTYLYMTVIGLIYSLPGTALSFASTVSDVLSVNYSYAYVEQYVESGPITSSTRIRTDVTYYATVISSDGLPTDLVKGPISHYTPLDYWYSIDDRESI